MKTSHIMASMALAALCAVTPAHALDGETLDIGPAGATDVLTIDASTNTQVFVGILQDFQALYPGMRVVYTELPTQTLYDDALARRAGRASATATATSTASSSPSASATAAGSPSASVRPSPDLIISSSMDLQTKLVNDGYAQPHVSPETTALPDWARWRNEVFSIGGEAMTIVYNTHAMTAHDAPRSRQQLLAMLRDPARLLQGKIGTYDVAHSGIGYMAATQDARRDSMAGALWAAMGNSAAVVDEYSDGLLDRIERGELTLGYNVLESYAQRRIAAGAPLAIVRPDDYTLVVSRVALIPRDARRPELAGRFLDYVLSARGQETMQRESRMLTVRTDLDAQALTGAMRPVALGTGLLVYLDDLKRQGFLQAWRGAIGQQRGSAGH